MSHLLLIRPLKADRYVSCFTLAMIMTFSRVAYQVLVWMCFHFSWYTPRVELWVHNSVFTILTVFQSGLSLLFISTNGHMGAPVSPVLNTCYYVIFIAAVLGAWCGVSWGFWFGISSLMANDGAHLFMCLLGPFLYLFWETSIQILESFKNWVIYLLLLSCKQFFSYAK